MEWVPGTAGRYVVRVKVAVGNKTVTQSEDVVVGDGAPTFFATTVPGGTRLSWPTSATSLKRFYTVTSTQPGGSPQNLTIGDPSIGTQVVPGLISGSTLLLTIADASGTFFYTAAATVQDDADANGCTSAVATLATSGGTCTVAAGATVTIQVPICSKCTDSNPSCQSEFVHDHVELAPVVQQCQADAGCSVNGCNINVPTVPCTVALPAGADNDLDADRGHRQRYTRIGRL
jgi:hypothetical protein